LLVSPLQILHPAATRWLSLKSVVKRLLSQYNTLTLFFTDQAYKNILEATLILNIMQKPETKLFGIFVICTSILYSLESCYAK
jgi:hypothetical protein